jgi:hypothetical protein
MIDNVDERNETDYHEPVLMFHKLEMYPQWFCDGEEHLDFTEKTPPDTSYEWNEKLNKWEKINTVDPDTETAEDNNG